MRILLTIGLLLIVVQQSVAPPVTQEKKENEEKPEDPDLEQMEYHRYLKEVVQVLESDPEFRDKLEKAKEADIRSGKIARELEFANHHVRSKLDEIKRNELERLKHLYRELGWANGLDKDHMEIAEHVDRVNPHTFEVDDLKKLIAKTTKDLDELDKQRKKQFKEYEMQKKFEQEEMLKGMSPEDRKKYEDNLHATEEKHKKHERLHHPGSKQQFEEVWEKKDHLGDQNFDPRTFFLLHDLDGNGAWDQDEVKALFSSELDKLYATGSPNQGDLRERAEEMERMREHVFKEADYNKDGFISFQEFLAETKKPGFQKDEGWESLDEQQIYTQQEYEAFHKQREEEIQKLIDQGVIPPYPDHMTPPHYQGPPGHGVPNPNYHAPDPNAQYQQQYPQHPQQGHPQYHQGQPPVQYHPGQVHPNEMNQGYPNQMHPGQNPPNQMYPDQHHPNQMQPGQVHPNQMPPGQVHPNQMQPGQVHPNQMPPGQGHPNQMQFGQGHPNQMQPGQGHPNQMQPEQGHPNQINPGQNHPNAIPQPHHQQGLPMHDSQPQNFQQGHPQPHVQELPHQPQQQVQNQQEHPQIPVQHSQQPSSNQGNHNPEKQQQNVANNIPVANKV